MKYFLRQYQSRTFVAIFLSEFIRYSRAVGAGRSTHIQVPFGSVYARAEADQWLREAASLDDWSAGGPFRELSEAALSRIVERHFRLTASGTAALELAALQLDLAERDNVIVPSYAFPACATAFARTGAQVRFADIDPVSGSICPESVERLLDARTRAVLTIHYAGACFRVAELASLCQEAGVPLIEDCAHALGARTAGRAAGEFGRFSAFSFHQTKNITCGEGGAIAFRDDDLLQIETSYWSGTNRAAYLAGEVAAYEWVSAGGSFGPSQFQAAVLLGQLQHFDAVQEARRDRWGRYFSLFEGASAEVTLPFRSDDLADIHASHIFYLVFRDETSRERVRLGLLADGIDARTHYQPLHASPWAARLGCVADGCTGASEFSRRMLRLPLHAGLSNPDLASVADRVLAHAGS